MRFPIGAAAGFVLLLFAGAAAAQYTVTRHVVAPGGKASQSGSHYVYGVVGQPSAAVTFGTIDQAKVGYLYSAGDIVAGGVATAVEDAPPLVTDLGQNYPNPFNPVTTISYSLARRGDVSIRVFNVRGQLVRTLVDESVSPGRHTIVWDGTNNAGAGVGTGIYFYRMIAGGKSVTKKMTLLK